MWVRILAFLVAAWLFIRARFLLVLVALAVVLVLAWLFLFGGLGAIGNALNRPAPVATTIAAAPTLYPTQVPYTPYPTQVLPVATGIPTNTPTPKQTAQMSLDRHGCPLSPADFMNQAENTQSPVAGPVVLQSGQVAMLWGSHVFVNGTDTGNMGYYLMQSGTYNVSVTDGRIRIYTLDGSTPDQFKAWAKCFVESDIHQSLTWQEIQPSTATGQLDRHGCPLSPADFMNQAENTQSPVLGPVVLAQGQVGMIWGSHVILNGTDQGKQGYYLIKAGSYNVSAQDGRVRMYTLDGSTLDEFRAWAKCFVEKDVNTTFNWQDIEPSAPAARATSIPQQGVAGDFGSFETQNISPVNGIDVHEGEICSVWWKVQENGVQIGQNATGVWLTKAGHYNISTDSRARCWKGPSLSQLRLWWEPQVQKEAGPSLPYTWIVR